PHRPTKGPCRAGHLPTNRPDAARLLRPPRTHQMRHTSDTDEFVTGHCFDGLPGQCQTIRTASTFHRTLKQQWTCRREATTTHLFRLRAVELSCYSIFGQLLSVLFDPEMLSIEYCHRRNKRAFCLPPRKGLKRRIRGDP